MKYSQTTWLMELQQLSGCRLSFGLLFSILSAPPSLLLVYFLSNLLHLVFSLFVFFSTVFTLPSFCCLNYSSFTPHYFFLLSFLCSIVPSPPFSFCPLLTHLFLFVHFATVLYSIFFRFYSLFHRVYSKVFRLFSFLLLLCHLFSFLFSFLLFLLYLLFSVFFLRFPLHLFSPFCPLFYFLQSMFFRFCSFSTVITPASFFCLVSFLSTICFAIVNV